MAVFFAILNPGDTYMGMSLAHGGHLSHGSPVNMSGNILTACLTALMTRASLIMMRY